MTRALLKTLAFVSLTAALAACSTFKKAMHAVGVATGDAELAKAESKLSPSQQYFFGRTISANFFATSPYLSNKDITEYVNLVGQYVAHHIDVTKKGGAGPYKGFHFAVVNNPTPMAMSAPGGFVFVSSGMIAQLKSEDQLAGVLAHEIGHVTYEHGLDEVENEATKKGVVKGIAIGAKALGVTDGDNPAESAAAAEGFSKFADVGLGVLINQPHSRDHEVDADKYSVRLLSRAGYYPGDYLELLNTVKSGGWLSKHPAGEERVEAVQKAMAKWKNTDSRTARKARFDKFKASVARAAGPAVRNPASQ